VGNPRFDQMSARMSDNKSVRGESVEQDLQKIEMKQRNAEKRA